MEPSSDEGNHQMNIKKTTTKTNVSSRPRIVSQKPSSLESVFFSELFSLMAILLPCGRGEFIDDSGGLFVGGLMGPRSFVSGLFGMGGSEWRELGYWCCAHHLDRRFAGFLHGFLVVFAMA